VKIDDLLGEFENWNPYQLQMLAVALTESQ
jgi:hypothetical protein